MKFPLNEIVANVIVLVLFVALLATWFVREIEWALVHAIIIFCIAHLSSCAVSKERARYHFQQERISFDKRSCMLLYACAVVAIVMAFLPRESEWAGYVIVAMAVLLLVLFFLKERTRPD